MQILLKNWVGIAQLLLLMFISGVVTLFLLRFYTDNPQAPPCADRVAQALFDREQQATLYDECLTDRFKTRYDNRDDWVDQIETRWAVPPFVTPLDKAFSQRPDMETWNIFYSAVVQTPQGPREQAVRLFLTKGKVDVILF